MVGTNLVRPGYPSAYFPATEWDGTTATHIRPDVVAPPNGQDFKRLAIEIIALQDHLNSLLTRSSDDNIELVNSVYKDFRFTINNLRVPASNGPEWTTYKSSEVLAFEDQAVAGNEERIFFTLRLPSDHKKGTNIRAHVHWIGEDDTDGNVYWQLTYNIAESGVTFSNDAVINVATENYGVDIHNYDELGVIDLSDYTDESRSIIFIGELRRNSSDALDTLTSKDAYLVELGFTYEANKFGFPSLENVSTIVKRFSADITCSGLVTAALLDRDYLTSAITGSGTVTASLTLNKAALAAAVTGSGTVVADLSEIV
jgi:hypothetical protein